MALKFLNVKNLDNDFNNNGGGTDAEHPLSAFADFSISDDEPVSVKKDDAPPVDNTVKPIIDNQPPIDTLQQQQNEKTAQQLEEEKKKQDAIAAGHDGKSTDANAKLPEDGIEFKIPQQDEPKVENWEALAKGLGFTEEVKDFTGFKTSYEKQINDLKKLAEDNKQVIDKESVYKQLDPEAADVLKYLDNGGSLQEYLKPGQIADQYLALDNEELVKQDLIARGYSEVQASEKTTKWMESGILDDHADEIRLELNQQKEINQQTILQQQQAIVQQKQQNDLLKEQNNTKAIQESLGKISNFMGGNITDDHRSHIMKEFSSGRTQELFKDPNVVAEFLLFKTFGDQALKTVKRQEYDKGKDRIQNLITNIPPVISSNNNRREENLGANKEGFDSWAAAPDLLYSK